MLQQILPPLIDNRYTPVRWLGSGAMGSVLLATDNHVDNREVAIKFLNPDLLAKDEHATNRFKREMQQLKELDGHGNIVRVLDFHTLSNGTFYLVMEYIRGGSLQDRLSKGLWPDEEQREKILQDLVTGLSYTHKKEVIHRDLKPANILIKAREGELWGTCVIGDYGVSVLSSALGISGESGGTGTQGYRAPEQRPGNLGEIGFQTDQYSLAVIAWELFTHQHPPVRPNEEHEPIPFGLQKVFEQALSEQKDSRFRSIDDFGKALLNAPAPPVRSPYKGLETYKPDDAQLFFGREPEIQRIVENLKTSQIWTVMGPSGSGKSSLVQSGVVNALRDHADRQQQDFDYQVVNPGQNPLLSLAVSQTGGFEPNTRNLVEEMRANHHALAGYLLEKPRDQEVLLIVDPLERLNSSDIPKEDAVAFIDNLAGVVESELPNISILLLMRSDFQDQFNVSTYGKSLKVITSHLIWINELDRDALKEVVVKPAEARRLLFSEDFIEKVLDDASGQPGALPLLSQALYLTWQERKGRQLTLSDYRALGGIHRVIEVEAEKAINELPTQEHRSIARRILLRLIQFNIGRPDTRRQQTEEQISSKQDPPNVFEETLKILSDHRLIVIEQRKNETFRRIDLAHEVLISRWERLITWIKDYREKEQVRRDLQAKVEEWQRRGAGPSGLLDKDELAEANSWLDSEEAKNLGFSSDLTIFIERSREAIDATIKREKRLILIQRIAFIVVSVLLLIAGVLGFYANNQRLGLAREVVVRSTAEAQAISNEMAANQARATAVANEARALLQLRVSTANGLASQANQEQKPQQNLLLAVEALRATKPGDPLVASVYQSLYQNLDSIRGFGIGGEFNPSNNPSYASSGITSVFISPDSEWLVAVGTHRLAQPPDSYIRIFHLTDIDPGLTQKEFAFANTDQVIGITSRNMLLVQDAVKDRLALWDLSMADPTKSPLTIAGSSPKIKTLSQDGNELVGMSEENALYLWDLRSPEELPVLISTAKLESTSLHLSPDHHWLAVLKQEKPFELIDLHTKVSYALQIKDSEKIVTSISFSADSRYIAAATEEPIVSIFDLGSPTPNQIELGTESRKIKEVVFSPNARYLAALFDDGNLHTWRLGQTGPALIPASFGSYQELPNIQISEDGWMGIGFYGNVILWDLTLKDPSSKSFSIYSNASFRIMPGAQWLISSTGPSVSAIGNIDVSMWNLINIRKEIFQNEQFQGQILSRDLTDEQYSMITRSLRGHEGPVEPVRFSPDGNWLLTTSGWPDGTMRLWDMRDLKQDPGETDFRRQGSAFQTKITFNKDGDWLVKIRNNQVWLLDLRGDYFHTQPIGPIQPTQETSAWFFSENRQLAAAEMKGGGTDIWNLSTHPPAQVQPAIPTQPGSKVLFSPDEKWMVIYDRTTKAQIWKKGAEDFALGKEIQFYKSSMYLGSPVFSEDSHWLAMPNSMNQLVLWDLTDPSLQTQYASPQIMEITKIAFSKDSKWMAVQIKDELGQPVALISKLDEYLWQLLSIDNMDYLSSDVTFSPDGRWLVVGSEKGNWFSGDALLIDMKKLARNLGQPVYLADKSLSESYANFMELSPDGRWLAVVQVLDVHLWDLSSTGKPPTIFTVGRGKGVTDVAFSPDSHWLAISGREFSGETVLLADLTTEGTPAFPVIYNRPVFQIDFFPDSSMLYADGELVDLNINRLISLSCAVAGRNLSQVEWHNYFPGLEYRITCPNISTVPIDKQ